MKTKTKVALVAGGLALLGLGGVAGALIMKKRINNNQMNKIYKQLKDSIVLLCKYDDYFDQMDMMECREIIGDILCDLESKCGKKNELCTLVPWFFIPD